MAGLFSGALYVRRRISSKAGELSEPHPPPGGSRCPFPFPNSPGPIRLTVNAFFGIVAAAGAENGLSVLLCPLRFLFEFVGITRVETRDP